MQNSAVGGLLPACVVWEMSQLQRNTRGTLQEHEGEAEEAEEQITGNQRAWQLQISRCLLLNL